MTATLVKAIWRLLYLTAIFSLNAVYCVRDELREAVRIADVKQVEFLLSLDQEVLNSRPPVLVNRTDSKYNRTSITTCGLDPQKSTRKAVDADCAEIAQALHAAGADLAHVDKYGWDALAVGASNGLSMFCEYLIFRGGVELNRQDNKGQTALMKASAQGFLDTAQVLVSGGAVFDIKDNSGLTALHYATIYALNDTTGNADYIRGIASLVTLRRESTALERKTAPVDELLDKDSRSCLMYAAISNNLPVVRALLDFGADPTLRDAFGVRAKDMSSDDYVRAAMAEASIPLIEDAHKKWLEAQLPFDNNSEQRDLGLGIANRERDSAHHTSNNRSKNNPKTKSKSRHSGGASRKTVDPRQTAPSGRTRVRGDGDNSNNQRKHRAWKDRPETSSYSHVDGIKMPAGQPRSDRIVDELR